MVTLFWLFFYRRDQRGETTTLTIERDGLFDISVTKILKEALLQPETIFQCFLEISGTKFSRREETMYFPGKGTYMFLKFFIFQGFWYFSMKNLLYQKNKQYIFFFAVLPQITSSGSSNSQNRISLTFLLCLLLFVLGHPVLHHRHRHWEP